MTLRPTIRLESGPFAVGTHETRGFQIIFWGSTASIAMVWIGSAAAAISFARGEPKAIWVTLVYFTVMVACPQSRFQFLS